MDKSSAILAAAVRRSAGGVRTVVRRRIELLCERVGEWGSVAKLMAIAGPRESVARFGSLALAALQMKCLDLGELVRLAAATQTEAWAPVAGRWGCATRFRAPGHAASRRSGSSR